MNDLKIFNEEIIPVYTTDTGEKVVIGRELHKKLGIGKDYSNWFKDMCKYGFNSGKEYSPISAKTSEQGGRPKIEHIVSLDMAKHIAMIQRSETGMQIRQKLIDLEKQINAAELPTGENLIAMALVEAQKILTQKDQTIKVQDQLIGELKPKADYTDSILKSKALVTISQIAKDYGLSGQEMNRMLHDMRIQYKCNSQWLLYAPHQAKGYTHSETVDITHSDGRRGVTMITKWTQKGRLFLYEALKSDGILPVIERQAC